MGIVETPLYHVQMTYIVAMRTKEGVLLASDGLAEYRDPNRKSLRVEYDNPKIFNLTDYIAIGFAGAVKPDMEAHINSLKYSIGFNDTSQSQLVAQIAGFSTMRSFAAMLERQEMDLHMLVVGYDLDDQKRPTEPKMYSMTHSLGEKISLITHGFYDIGHNADVRQKLEPLYQKSHKGYKSLKKLAIKAVNESAQIYPDAVGGNIFIKHITKKGIFDEIIPYNVSNG